MKITSAVKMIFNILPLVYDDDVEEGTDVARIIGQIIYELPNIKSGLVSKSVVDEHGFRGSKFTPEHFYSRQRAGRTIVEHFKNENLSAEKLLDMLVEYSMVHLVTFDENMQLARIQKAEETRDLTPIEQYRIAGIELIKDRGPAPIWYADTYTIDGVVYSNIHDASLGLDLDYKTILKRCAASKNGVKRWAQYNRIKGNNA